METQLSQNQSQKRISLDDLYAFIKTNKSTFQTIGCINLNDSTHVIEDLEKLHFQDVRKIQMFPPNISNFLQTSDITHKYLHAGTFVLTKGSLNLSLFSSIICCLKRSFLSQTIISQEKFLLALLTRFKKDIESLFLLHKYDKFYNWNHIEIIADLTNGIFSGQLLHLLCDYFCINIFVLYIDDDSIFFGGGLHYIPYRKHIFLIKYDGDIFEPLFTEQTRLFTLSDELTKSTRKNIRNTKLYSVYGSGITKPEEFEEDLFKYNPPVKKSKRELFNQKNQIILDNTNVNLSAAIKQLKEGVLLWKLCVILSLLFLLAEVLLIRFWK